MRNTYRILLQKPEEESPLREPKHKWENIIRKDLREMEWKV